MNEETAWAMYFSGIVAFQYHPRNEAAERMSIKACADVADQMLIEHRMRQHRRANHEFAVRPMGVI